MAISSMVGGRSGANDRIGSCHATDDSDSRSRGARFGCTTFTIYGCESGNIIASMHLSRSQLKWTTDSCVFSLRRGRECCSRLDHTLGIFDPIFVRSTNDSTLFMGSSSHLAKPRCFAPLPNITRTPTPPKNEKQLISCIRILRVPTSSLQRYLDCIFLLDFDRSIRVLRVSR